MNMTEYLGDKFVTVLYTIEYDGIVGGHAMRMYAEGNRRGDFSNICGEAKTWKSCDKVRRYVNSLDTSVKNRMLQNNPSVVSYTYDKSGIVRSVIGIIL